MYLFRKGDIVARNSYNRDILFEIKRIIKIKDKEKIYILKGITERIEADSTEDDLVKIDRKIANVRVKKMDNKIYNYIDQCLQEEIQKKENMIWKRKTNRIVFTGRILHLDGDTRYAEKSARYYKNLGLNAVVKNISEDRQPRMVFNLLDRYKPDIVIVTRS